MSNLFMIINNNSLCKYKSPIAILIIFNNLFIQKPLKSFNPNILNCNQPINRQRNKTNK